MEISTFDPETRAILMKKLVTICSICGKLIFGRDIDMNKLNNVSHWPASYEHQHAHKNIPMHSLTLYIDANLAVRGQEAHEPLLNKN